jgi:transcriptional regulator with XRE-family HTH domain
MTESNTMVLLATVPQAQKRLSEHLRARRIAVGFTQEGLAKRSGVKLPTLRKFEQKGVISLEGFLKLLMALDALERMMNAIKPENTEFASIDEVLATDKKPTRQKGWRA